MINTNNNVKFNKKWGAIIHKLNTTRKFLNLNKLYIYLSLLLAVSAKFLFSNFLSYSVHICSRYTVTWKEFRGESSHHRLPKPG